MAVGKALAVFCGLLLIQSYVCGMSPFGKQRCLCKGRGAERISTPNIKKLEVFPASFGCDEVEVVATMKSGNMICLNAQSKFVNKLMTALRKKRSSK
ncbi:C-X-C motif chemokine 10 [Xenopus laevis]|uniref:Chemokine interleukin-8-like domain-containing protein n=2 Tax=Xenopus laevis TaxID=8355 RepID=A0A974DTQ4_XENLA|nr:C-X-C motif chemokine 10 [Xenopus laevis]OCT97290.1 hypothetical protein XELAEV_18009517mg [Xenopus laevis]